MVDKIVLETLDQGQKFGPTSPGIIPAARNVFRVKKAIRRRASISSVSVAMRKVDSVALQHILNFLKGSRVVWAARTGCLFRLRHKRKNVTKSGENHSQIAAPRSPRTIVNENDGENEFLVCNDI